MPWDKVSKVLEEEWDEPPEELFEDFEQEAAAAASIGQVHRAMLPDGRRVAVKIQYPGVAEALRADMQNAGMILRMAKALAPGLDAKAAAEELKERVLEELDYEYEAQNQRAFARGYRGHPFIYVPDVVTRLSTERVLVTEWVDGMGFDDVKAAAAGREGPLRRDRLPLLLRLDLPPAALQRRRPPGQLHPHGGRPRGVPRLRHDQAARQGADRARDRGARGGVRGGPGAAARGAARPRLPQQPQEGRRRAADGARAGGRRLVHGGPRGHDRLAPGDGGDRRGVRPALGLLRPDAARERARQRADGPAHGVRRAGRARPARAPRATGTGSAASGGSPRSRRRSSAARSGPTSSRRASSARASSPRAARTRSGPARRAGSRPRRSRTPSRR